MRLVINDLIRQRRFVFDGDEPGSIDPITILLNEDTKTCTITDNFGTTFSHTWRGFNTKDNDFIKFFEHADRDNDYFCGKLGLFANRLNLKKSKKNAIECFFSYINKDTSKDERIWVIHAIQEIETNNPNEFELRAHSIIDEYSDAWECDFRVMEWEGTNKNMKEALIELASVIRREYSNE